jgi:hypothetical protein
MSECLDSELGLRLPLEVDTVHADNNIATVRRNSFTVSINISNFHLSSPVDICEMLKASSAVTMMAKQSPMIIVGGGAWGLSTALHLNLAGYSNITVFDRGEEMPSRYSAAWDLNKIVRAEYEDPFYTDLSLVCSSLCSTTNDINDAQLLIFNTLCSAGKTQPPYHDF